MNNKGVMAASFMGIIGDAAIDERHLAIRVLADVTLVSYHDNSTSTGVQLSEQFQY